MREYPERHLRECKESPHNVTVVKDAFITETEDLTIAVASNKFVNISQILIVDDFEIISVTKEGQYPQFGVNFFDKNDNWVAIIEENQWYVDRRFVWDIEYQPRHLTLRCQPRRISFDVKIVDDTVYIRGDLYFNGYSIEATNDDLFLGGRSAMQIRNSTVRGGRFLTNATAFDIHTGRVPFSNLSPRKY